MRWHKEPKTIESMNLAETIYANMIMVIYADLAKAKNEDLRKLAEQAMRAAQIYVEVARVV